MISLSFFAATCFAFAKKLDILESGGYREPFKGNRWAVPYSKTTREGGTFGGKVMTRFRWDRLNLRETTPKRGPRKGKKTI
ncbi:MAG: hypothetical protein LBC63_01230, partial [Holophagales bacterium]|nr:hypothetical protein [Holophagales bacterium]